MNLKLTAAGVLLISTVLTFAVAANDSVKELTVEGSTTVGPIADAFAETLMRKNPGLQISVKKTGSGDGAAALIDGRCDVATMSRFMKPEEFKKAVDKGIYPVANTIAMDGVCIILHPSNPVKALTLEQIKGIYEGKITNWNELGGADTPIVAISRDTSSGTYEVFHEKAMHKQDMGSKVEYVNSNPQAHARVKTTPGAIAYVGLGFVDNDVKAVTVNGIAPTRDTIATGEYPISRALYMFTNGETKPGTPAHIFVKFYLSEAGQEIIEAKGFVPVTKY